MNAELQTTAAQSPDKRSDQMAQLSPQLSKLYTPAEYFAILEKLKSAQDEEDCVW